MSPVGAYRIRPTKRPGRGNLIYLWVGVFIPAGYIWGVFFCAPTLPAEKTPGTQLDLSTHILTLSFSDLRFLMSPVGAYRIRPTNDPAGAILSIYG